MIYRSLLHYLQFTHGLFTDQVWITQGSFIDYFQITHGSGATQSQIIDQLRLCPDLQQIIFRLLKVDHLPITLWDVFICVQGSV